MDLFRVDIWPKDGDLMFVFISCHCSKIAGENVHLAHNFRDCSRGRKLLLSLWHDKRQSRGDLTSYSQEGKKKMKTD